MMAVYSGGKGDKYSFRKWSGKLINQFAVAYQGARDIFAELKKMLNQKRA